MGIICFIFAVLMSYGIDNVQYFKPKKIILGLLLILFIFSSLWIVTVISYRYPIITVEYISVVRRNLIWPTTMLFISVILIIFYSHYPFRRGKRILMGLIILVIGLDLFRFGWKFTPFTSLEYFFPYTRTIEFLQNQKQPYRIMVLDDRILPSNVSAYYEIPSIDGYDPITTLRYEEFAAANERSEPNIDSPFGFNRIISMHNTRSPLWKLLQVKYILSLDSIDEKDFTMVFQEGNTKIYSYNRSLPYAYFVETVQVMKNKKDVIHMLYDDLFNPLQKAIIEEPLLTPLSEIQSVNDTVQLLSKNNTQVVLETYCETSRYLVISEQYDTHWRARVNSVIAPIYRTNYVLQGLIVPPGKNTIVLSYGVI
jgi:uncharacterized membrane protein YfhO